MSHLRTNRLGRSCSQCCSTCVNIRTRGGDMKTNTRAYSTRRTWELEPLRQAITTTMTTSTTKTRATSRSTSRRLSTTSSSSSAFSSFFQRNKPPPAPTTGSSAGPAGDEPTPTESTPASSSTSHTLILEHFYRAIENNDLPLLKSSWNKLLLLRIPSTSSPSSSPAAVVPPETLERALELLSRSRNTKDVQDMIRFAALDSPHLPLSSLSSLGAESLARGLYQLGQRPLLEKLFIGSTVNPNIVGIGNIETLVWVLRALIRGRKDGPGLQLSLRRVKQLIDSHRAILDVPGAEKRVYEAVVEEYATREAYEEFERIWQDILDKGLTLDEAVEVKALRMARRGKAMGRARDQDFHVRQKEGRLGVNGWNWILQSRLDGAIGSSSATSSSSLITDVVEETVKEMRKVNVEPNQDTFTLIVSAKIADIPVDLLAEDYVDRVWETSSILGLDPEDRVWESCVEQVADLINKPTMEEGDKRESIYSAYERAVRAGSQVTIRLARMIVDRVALDSAGFGPDYARVNNIKADLAAAMDESSEIMLDVGRTLKERDDDLRTIHLVSLEGAMKPGGQDETAKDIIPDTIAVLDEMRKRSIALPHQMTLSVILDLMSRAQHHHDAFRAYSYVRALAPGRLSEEDHLVILQHFIRLSLPKSPWPLPKLTFEFLRDMRDSGLPVRAKVYTMMVTEYTRYLRRRRKGRVGNAAAGVNPAAPVGIESANGPDQRVLSNTLQTIQKIHSIVKLDSFLDVDLPLLTSLMDAYNQLQLWPETFELWNEIVARHRMERGVDSDVQPTPTTLQLVAYRPALSVILDACGYSGHLSRARRIWEWAHERDMIRCSYGNWKSWIECLCRCGKTMEACDVVRGPFKKQWLATRSAQGSMARTDVDTGEPDLLIAKSSIDENELPVLEMLIRFSWRDKSDWLEVRSMIETEFPEQWEVLRASKMVKGREVASEQYGE